LATNNREIKDEAEVVAVKEVNRKEPDKSLQKFDWKFWGLLIFAAIYFFSPLDLLPEALLGPLGFADDAALLAFVIKRVIDKVRSR